MVEEAENVQPQEGQVSENVESVDQPGSQVDQTAEASAPENTEDRNFVEMRKKNEELQRKNDEAMQIIRNIEAQKQQQQQPEEEPEPEVNFGADDDLVEAKHIKVIYNEMKRTRKEFEEYKKQSTAMTADARLKANYPDIDKVASDENLATLKKEDPDLYASILHNPDPYSQYSAAYSAIKRYGIYKEDKYVTDKQKAQANMNKPRPLNSVSPQQGDSPLSRVNAFSNSPLTEDLKKQYWKEVQEAIKGG